MVDTVPHTVPHNMLLITLQFSIISYFTWVELSVLRYFASRPTCAAGLLTQTCLNSAGHGKAILPSFCYRFFFSVSGWCSTFRFVSRTFNKIMVISFNKRCWAWKTWAYPNEKCITIFFLFRSIQFFVSFYVHVFVGFS